MKLELTEQNTGEERATHRERTLEFYRTPLSFQMNTDQCMHRRELHEVRERATQKD